MIGAGDHLVVEIGAKAQALVPARALDRKRDRNERGVLDLDAPFLDRSDQPVGSVVVAAQDRGEQLDQRFAADGRAVIEPSAVARDPHVEIAAKRRLPPARALGG